MLRKYIGFVLRSPDVNTESASSTESEATRESQDVKQTETSSTESSTEEKDVKPLPTLQDEIKDLLEKSKAKKDSSTEQKKEEKTEEKKEEVKADKKDETKAEDSTVKKEDVKKEPDLLEQKDKELPKRAQERVREVISQRKEVEAQLEQVKPVAERMQKIETFCQQNGISAKDYDDALMLTALLKKNPAEGIKQLESKLSEFKIAIGEALPADLAAEVKEGTLSEAQAKREAKTRVEAAALKRQQEQSTQSYAQRQYQELNSTLQTWMQSKTATDADYKPKASQDAPDGKFEIVQDRFLAMWNNPDKYPVRTVADAVKLMEKAYDSVNGFVKQHIPVTPVRRPVSSNGSRTKESKTEETIDITKSGWARKAVHAMLDERSS